MATDATWCGFSGGPGQDGVAVFAPDATLLGRILLPERCANRCFGGRKRNRLFMTASQSVHEQRDSRRESKGGGQFQRGAFSVGHYAHGSALVSSLSVGLSPCGRTDGRARRPPGPCHCSALSPEVQSPVRSSLPPAQTLGVGELVDGRDAYQDQSLPVLSRPSAGSVAKLLLREFGSL